MRSSSLCRLQHALHGRVRAAMMRHASTLNSDTITLRWIKDGEDAKDESKVKVTSHVPLGISILDAAHRYNIDLEGSCESSLACSTCHVILEEHVYDTLLPQASDEEYDLLDVAFGLTETSRLGCQVILTRDMHNMLITLPVATRNFYVDGHKPEPH
mmetsp:Transcript_15612/g.24680  ORF Transcript_15612/g.24680 Transcript_15612/m.24680 type:complete len:157 (+) Transcript_15612:1556-2026(+)